VPSKVGVETGPASVCTHGKPQLRPPEWWLFTGLLSRVWIVSALKLLRGKDWKPVVLGGICLIGCWFGALVATSKALHWCTRAGGGWMLCRLVSQRQLFGPAGEGLRKVNRLRAFAYLTGGPRPWEWLRSLDIQAPARQQCLRPRPLPGRRASKAKCLGGSAVWYWVDGATCVLGMLTKWFSFTFGFRRLVDVKRSEPHVRYRDATSPDPAVRRKPSRW
jgi:hypothetical protein